MRDSISGVDGSALGLKTDGRGLGGFVEQKARWVRGFGILIKGLRSRF